ncbi:bidirectional sugar transporter SWEET17-like [Phoenix dactylifera]|uniref:Bidirectional sugar transporter SWEET n=1 Tax=Phoenix dactylifera TaxID=42345 RepID=A0A8B8ZSF5_PHODC|nr:bidirectional sugar transporter SWEET17-like [Phoenix dactylifera]
MEALLFFIGVVGNVISVLVFASPIKTFWRIVKNGSTEGFEPSPYVVTLLSSSLWVYYGITKPDGFLVATVNGVGIVLEAIYVTLFLIYAAPSLRAKTAILVALLDLGIFGAVVLVTRLVVIEETTRVIVIGAICACLNVFMYGSPLAAMKTVIATKSVEYMPFFLSFFLFLNGGIWTVYAVLDRDIFLGIPNGIGFFLGTIQLVLYMIYMNTKVSKHSGEAVEGRSQQQRLLEPDGACRHDEEEGQT